MEDKTLQTQENQIAMLVHLSTLMGWIVPLGNIIAPLFIWQLKRSEYPSLDEHGKEVLNFQISLTIYTIISVILVFVIIGFFGLFAVLIIDLILTIKASIAANNGKVYHYPLSIKFIK